MACIVTAYIGRAYVVMAYIVMVYIAIAYLVRAYVAMTYIVMVSYVRVICSPSSWWMMFPSGLTLDHGALDVPLRIAFQ